MCGTCVTECLGSERRLWIRGSLSVCPGVIGSGRARTHGPCHTWLPMSWAYFPQCSVQEGGLSAAAPEMKMPWCEPCPDTWAEEPVGPRGILAEALWFRALMFYGRPP